MSPTAAPPARDERSDAGPGRPRAPRPARFFAAAAVAFFLFPAIAYAFGMRARAIENRPLAPFPKASSAWGAFDGLGAWYTDRLPFRPDAVKWRADIYRWAFDENPPAASGAIEAVPNAAGGGAASAGSASNASSPSLGESPALAPKKKSEQDFIRLPPVAPEPPVPSTSLVVGGKDGWLYLAGELYKECNPGQPPANVIAGLKRLDAILTASGRKFVVTLAPDKSTVEGQHLPASYPFSNCAPQAKDATYSALGAAGLSGYIDARALLETRQTTQRRDYYLRKDSHWNGLAEAAISLEIARKLDPAVTRGAVVHESIGTYTGDLTSLLGTPAPDQSIFTSITRAGVTATRAPNPPLSGLDSAATSTTSTGAPLFPGPVFMVGDSFSAGLVDELSPFVSSMVWLHNGMVRQAPRTTAGQIKAARAVVLVWNERYFADPAYGVLWSPQFLDRLQQELG
jgi:alginate O-acetyltransferase complex protein AlgJ